MANDLDKANEDVIWQVANSLIDAYLVSTIGIFVSLLTAIVLLVASYRLYKKAKVKGGKLIFIGIVGYIFGFVTYSMYLSSVDDVQQLVADLAGLFLTICYAVGAYGFWLLSKSIVVTEDKN